MFLYLHGHDLDRREQAEAQTQANWVSNRAFWMDRPIQKLTKGQPTIVLDQMFILVHFKPTEDTP